MRSFVHKLHPTLVVRFAERDDGSAKWSIDEIGGLLSPSVVASSQSQFAIEAVPMAAVRAMDGTLRLSSPVNCK